MAFPISGAPAFPGAAAPPYTGVFIPALWSGKVIEKFYDATVLAAICNTSWEGEISNYGDKVTIRTKPTLTIKTYQAGQPLVYEKPSSNVVELNIDQGAYFGAVLDDVMEVQADLNQLSMWADDASEQMKIFIDSNVLLSMFPGVVTANKGTTAGRISARINLGAVGAPVILTRDIILEKLIDLGTVLDEQNIPETGRWVVMPAWACGMLKKSELRDASLTGDNTSVMRNGRLGMIDRFTIYSSNLLPTSLTDGIPASDVDLATYIYAGHSHGATFAAQVTRMETLRAESTFGNLLRGLSVWGRKVVDGTALAILYAKAG